MIHPLVHLEGLGFVYIVDDLLSGKRHLWYRTEPVEPTERVSTTELFSSSRLSYNEPQEKYLCGMGTSPRITIVSAEEVLHGAPVPAYSPVRIEQLEGQLKRSVCGNCFRVLKSQLSKQKIPLNDMLGTLSQRIRGGMYPLHTAGAESVPRYATKSAFLHHNLDKSKERTTNVDGTSIIYLEMKVEFDLEYCCPTDIADAVEEIKEKATDHGRIDKARIFSDGPINFDVD
jgi:hypothetical protein